MSVSVKHLPGMHNQMSHGRGGSAGGVESGAKSATEILSTNVNHTGEPGESFAKEWVNDAEGGTNEQKLSARLLKRLSPLEGTRVLTDDAGRPQAMYTIQTAGGGPYKSKHRAIKDVQGDYVELVAIATAPNNLKPGGDRGWGTAAMEAGLEHARSTGARYVTAYAQSKGGQHLLEKHGFQSGHKKKPYYYLELKKQKQFHLMSSLSITTAAALDFKARLYRRDHRRNVARKVYLEQEKRLEDKLVRALTPLFEQEIEETVARLLELAPEEPAGEKHLPGQHNQMSHGRGSMAADTGGNTSGGGSAGDSGEVEQVKILKKIVDEKDVPEAFTSQGERTKELVREGGLQEAIDKYTRYKRDGGEGRPYHEELNEKLRSRKPLDDDPELLSISSDLDKVASQDFSEPVTVYRGVADPGDSEHSIQFLSKVEEMLNSGGGTIQDSGFGSTSASPSTARRFAGWDTRNDTASKVIMQIEGVRKGAYIEGVTKFDSEFEVLLPRNTEVEVLGISRGVTLEGSRGKFIVVQARAVYHE